MRILGIDTATSIASAALIEDGHLVAQQVHPNRESTNPLIIPERKANHAEIILPLIEAVLRKAVLSPTDLSGFAVAIGPGSFTGLRVGLSTVKGIAYGLGAPVVGISTLLANAARVNDFDGLICSFLDARKKEVYAALFRRDGEALTRITEDRVASVRAVIGLVGKLAGSAPCLFIGDVPRTYDKLITDELGKKVLLSSGESYPPLASAVARLSETQIRRADGNGLGSLVPVYLHASEAELKRNNLV
jgi:tRNA threonylcarbamoyladenosine biosynthesis protein TsaB